MQKVIMLLMTTLLWLPLNAKVWNGTRNTDWYDDSRNYFEISTAEELAGLAELVNAGNAFNNKTIKLMADIVLNEDVLDENGNLNRGNAFKEWNTIGYTGFGEEATAFSGTFDGNGHIIFGLCIMSSSSYNNGLFAEIDNRGSIKDLGLEDGYVTTGNLCYRNRGTLERCYSQNTIMIKGEGGGICFSNEGRIYNCYNLGLVLSNETNGNLGGICSRNNGQIGNCYNAGSLVGGEQAYVGGICMENMGSIENCHNIGDIIGGYVAGVSCLNSANILNCYNGADLSNNYEYGEVNGICSNNSNNGIIVNCANYGKLEALGTYVRANGICGSCGSYKEDISTIRDCTNEGEIIGVGEYSSSCGICGSNRGTVTNCTNEGEIIGVGEYSSSCGICGSSRGTVTNCTNVAQIVGRGVTGGICVNSDDNGVISDCYNVGEINVQCVSGTDIGGICARAYDNSTIQNCFNKGNITIRNTENDDEYSFDWIGGICARLEGSVENSYNVGNITAREKVIVDVSDRIGGICAYMSRGIIRNCYNLGNIFGRKEATFVRFVGDYIGGISGDIIDNASIENCCNLGSIIGLETSSITWIGSICGSSNNDIIKNDFYLVGTYDKPIGGTVYRGDKIELSGSEMVDVMNTIFTSTEGWQSSAYSMRNTIYLPTLGDEEPPTLAWNITANESIFTVMKEGIAKVYTQNSLLCIHTSQPKEVAIITMNGAVLRRERQEGLRSYSLPKGVYIICIGEERMKVRL